MGHVSLEPGGSDSLGLNESLCGVVWRWLDQRFSLRVQALPSVGSTDYRKLCLDFSLFLAGSCSYRGCRGSFSCLSFSSWDETARLICGGAIPHNKYRSSTLVGLRHPEMALHAAFRTGSIFEACDDLLQIMLRHADNVKLIKWFYLNHHNMSLIDTSMAPLFV